MNKGQYDLRLRAFNARAKELDDMLQKAIQTKSYDQLSSLQGRVDDLARERKAPDDAAERFESPDPRYAALKASGWDLGSEPRRNASARCGTKKIRSC
jgi:hypothetical protein